MSTSWGAALVSLPSAGLLVPGSKAGLNFTGIPLLQPYARWALASMVASLAVAVCLQRTWQSRGHLQCPPASWTTRRRLAN